MKSISTINPSTQPFLDLHLFIQPIHAQINYLQGAHCIITYLVGFYFTAFVVGDDSGGSGAGAGAVIGGAVGVVVIIIVIIVIILVVVFCVRRSQWRKKYAMDSNNIPPKGN